MKKIIMLLICALLSFNALANNINSRVYAVSNQNKSIFGIAEKYTIIEVEKNTINKDNSIDIILKKEFKTPRSIKVHSWIGNSVIRSKVLESNNSYLKIQLFNSKGALDSNFFKHIQNLNILVRLNYE